MITYEVLQNFTDGNGTTWVKGDIIKVPLPQSAIDENKVDFAQNNLVVAGFIDDLGTAYWAGDRYPQIVFLTDIAAGNVVQIDPPPEEPGKTTAAKSAKSEPADKSETKKK